MPDAPVLIRCDACGSRFRFDPALIGGHRGARFRCRRCGHPIVVSVPGVPSALPGAVPPGFRSAKPGTMPFPDAAPQTAVRREPASGRSVRSGPMSVPAAEAAQEAEPIPDNLVDLRRIRKPHRAPAPPEEQEPSDRIAKYILASVPVYPEEEPGVPSSEHPASRTWTDSPLRGDRAVSARWPKSRSPRSPKRAAFLSSAQNILLFAMFGAAIACVGFYLVLYFAG